MEQVTAFYLQFSIKSHFLRNLESTYSLTQKNNNNYGIILIYQRCWSKTI